MQEDHRVEQRCDTLLKRLNAAGAHALTASAVKEVAHAGLAVGGVAEGGQDHAAGADPVEDEGGNVAGLALVNFGPGGQISAAQWQMASQSLHGWADEHGAQPSEPGIRVTFLAHALVAKDCA